MKEFIAINDKLGLPQRLVMSPRGYFYNMTEYERVEEVNSEDYVYLGEPGAKLRPDTIMWALVMLASVPHPCYDAEYGEFERRMKQYGLRCDSNNDMCQITIELTEEKPDNWSMMVHDDLLDKVYDEVPDFDEEGAKAMGRRIIETAIALGVDISVNWKFKRLETTESN